MKRLISPILGLGNVLNVINCHMKHEQFVRYNGCTNNLDMFGTLKATFKGASHLGGGDSGSKSRAIHPSFIGNVSLVTTSSADPGVVVSIVPFARIENNVFVDRFRAEKKE